MEMMVHSSMTVRSKHYGKILKTEVSTWKGTRSFTRGRNFNVNKKTLGLHKYGRNLPRRSSWFIDKMKISCYVENAIMQYAKRFQPNMCTVQHDTLIAIAIYHYFVRISLNAKTHHIKFISTISKYTNSNGTLPKSSKYW